MDEDTIRASVAESDRKLLERGAKTIDWIAAAETLEESQRRGAVAWAEQVERPRMLRRIAAARHAKTRPVRLVGVIRPRPRGAGRPRAQAARSSVRSGDSGDGLDPPDLSPSPQWVDGRCALLRRLIKRGLAADAVESAAELICALDEYAAA
jgi:hypothetical protein